MGEIDLRGEERGARDAIVSLRCEVAERRGEERATDAVADGVDRRIVGDLARDPHRFEDAVAHVVVEGQARVPLRGVHPGDDEDGMPLLDQPADHRLLGVEVEDVELVDPRRHEQEGAPQHGLRLRRILQELEEIVAKDDRARRVGDVLAENEGRRVRLAKAKRAATGLQVADQRLQTAQEVGSILLQRLFEKLRVGCEVVGRRGCREHLVEVEGRLVPRVLVEIVRVGDKLAGPAVEREIALAHDVE